MALEDGYRRRLSYFIANKWISLALLGVCIALIVIFSKTLKSELAPLEDHSYIRTAITAPEGTEYGATQFITDRVARMLQDSIPEANYVLARYGGGMSNTSANTGAIDQRPGQGVPSKGESHERCTNRPQPAK